MKKEILTIATFIALATTATAQVSKDDFLYSPFTMGIYGGGTILKGDVPVTKISGAGKVSFDYNFSPYMSIGLEGQYGRLVEGKKANVAEGGLYNENAYGSIGIIGRLAAGQLTRRSETGIVNLARRIYLATGLSYIRTHAITVERGPMNLGGNDNSGVFAVPTNIGMDIPLKKTVAGMPVIQLNLNYQFNFVLSDNLDAFNYSSSFNEAKDAYTLFSIGLKFSLGRATGEGEALMQ